MMKALSKGAEGDGLAALSLMDEALAVLDRSGFALEIGAQLDLAINRLRGMLTSPLPIQAMDLELNVADAKVAGAGRNPKQ